MDIGTRVRNRTDGQIGWVVEHEERIMVRLDRKQQQLIVPFKEGDWLPDTLPRLGPIQRARVHYAADRALRLVTGEYGIEDWTNPPGTKQVAFTKEPEGADPLRLELYRAIKKVLEGK